MIIIIFIFLNDIEEGAALIGKSLQY